LPRRGVAARLFSASKKDSNSLSANPLAPPVSKKQKKMAFVGLGGDAASRPTFFELVAADRLMPALRSATSYTLAVLAQARPRGLPARLLAWEDEVLALLTAALDGAALASPTSPGSFADGLYGLRRAVSDPAAPGGLDRGALSARDRARTLLALALLPYARAKGDALHRRLVAAEVEARRRAQEDGGVVAAALPAGEITAAEEEDGGGGASTSGLTLARARSAAATAYVRAYPAAVAALEALRLAYQLGYLLDLAPPGAGPRWRRRRAAKDSASSTSSTPADPVPPYFSPTLAALGQVLVRVSGSELASEARALTAQRDAALLLASSRPFPRVRTGLLRARWAAGDYARPALILAVFAFKGLEWWYASGEAALGSATGSAALPPPPPPPIVPPAPDGVPLPSDPTACPLCRRARTNPALSVPSGYVFCYPCLHAHAVATGECPVTRLPLGVGGVRRLYEAS
jgi:peroxin-12